MSESSSLLRLFESSFFDTWLAVSYLFKYTDVGVQDYLCKRLLKTPEAEIQYFLPQLCHLLVTRPSSSASLENFLIDLCSRSSHSALLMMWYLRGYLDDLHEKNPIKYNYCLKVYLRCQQLFEVTPNEKDPNSIQSSNSSNLRELQKHKENGNKNGNVITNESSSEDEYEDDGDYSEDEEDIIAKQNSQWMLLGMGLLLASFGIPSIVPRFQELLLAHSFQHISENPTPKLLPKRRPSREQLQQKNCFSFQKFLKDNHIKLDNLDSNTQNTLLKKHYIQAENLFVLLLMDIGKRLVSVSKENRQSVLSAELTLLNDNLPARVCFPLWCSLSNSNQHHGPNSNYLHDQIVRIPVKDCAVLNSKEKVPYVIQVEVLRSTNFNSSLKSMSQDIITSSNETEIELSSGPNLISINRIQHHNSIHSLTTKSSLTSSQSSLDLPMPEQTETETEKQHFHLEVGAKLETLNFQNSKENQNQNGVNTNVNIENDTLNRNASDTLVTFPPLSPSLSLVNSESRGINNEDEESRNMKVASIMLSQLSRKEEQIVSEFERKDIENKIVQTLKEHSKQVPILTHEDPSALLLDEDWETKRERIRKESPWGKHPNWDLISVIVKYGDDLRQEQLASQIISEMKNVWERDQIPIWVHPCRVVVTSHNSGFIQTVPSAISLHSLKKRGSKTISGYTLLQHFLNAFGERGSPRFEEALTNFISSLVGYSIISYLLQLRDRHNGNILLDKHGHLVHIDFGFLLSNSPGAVAFEGAPFKLSQEYIDLMGGTESEHFKSFKSLFKQGFLVLRKYTDNFELLLKIMYCESSLPCFIGGDEVVAEFRERFHTSLTDQQFGTLIDELIEVSCNNVYTRLYDQYQYFSNGTFV